MPTPIDFSRFEVRLRDLTLQQFRVVADNGLRIAASIVEDAAKKLAPKHVGNFIQHSQVIRDSETRYFIRVFVKLSDAPDAAAWEFGSGLHRTRSAPSLYPIEAKNVPNLVFWWERRQKWFVGPELPIGHPGIAPRPYLKPALENNIDRIKREFFGKAA